MKVDIFSNVRFGAVGTEVFHFSPLLFLISYFCPALLANRQYFAFYLDIQFDIFAVTSILPGVFTMLHLFSSETPFGRSILLSRLLKRQFGAREG
jgi:hypothetical protein